MASDKVEICAAEQEVKVAAQLVPTSDRVLSRGRNRIVTTGKLWVDLCPW